jgi:cyclopropane fatty-acyl-phospholipid synthase-like methyltransferase
MDKELQKYYEERFNTMSTEGWKDFIQDVQEMYDTYNKINSTETFEDFHKRKGQLDILQWILTLKQVSEQTYEDLKDEETL